MYLRLLTFSAFITHCSLGQLLQNGLISPTTDDKDSICCIYSPKDGFSVYDNPNGRVIGTLTRDVSENQGDQARYRIYFVDISTKSASQISLENFQETDYERWSINYFERREGSVRIINKNLNYWLNENEIQKSGFAIFDWQSFLSNNNNLMGFYANEPGLNLREGPTAQSKLLKTLRGKLYEISPTKEHRGLWTKVKVIKRKQHPCGATLRERDNIEYELSGWVKLVDDNGRPNVWYYSRGC